MSDVVKPTLFKRADIVDVSDNFLGIASNIAGRQISPSLDISRISVDEKGQIAAESSDFEERLSPLTVLRDLRDLETYRGRQKGISRLNILTVARLGGSALYEIDRLSPAGEYSEATLSALQQALVRVNGQMMNSFVGIAYNTLPDKDSVNLLRLNRKTLRRPVKLPS